MAMDNQRMSILIKGYKYGKTFSTQDAIVKELEKMSNNQTERERIVKELQDKFYWIPTGPCANEIATWHLEEVKRIVEPLNNLLKLEKNGFLLGGEPDAAIKETLKRANGGE